MPSSLPKAMPDTPTVGCAGTRLSPLRAHHVGGGIRPHHGMAPPDHGIMMVGRRRCACRRSRHAPRLGQGGKARGGRLGYLWAASPLPPTRSSSRVARRGDTLASSSAVSLFIPAQHGRSGRLASLSWLLSPRSQAKSQERRVQISPAQVPLRVGASRVDAAAGTLFQHGFRPVYRPQHKARRRQSWPRAREQRSQGAPPGF